MTILSIIKSQFTNIKGKRAEFSRRTFKEDDRHWHKEAKSQKAQLESSHKHGTRKDVKVKMDRKLT